MLNPWPIVPGWLRSVLYLNDPKKDDELDQAEFEAEYQVQDMQDCNDHICHVLDETTFAINPHPVVVGHPRRYP